jgi:hypothetical protein
LGENLGFYASLLLFLLGTVLAGVFFYYNNKNLKKNLNNIIYNDNRRFCPKQITAEEYFGGSTEKAEAKGDVINFEKETSRELKEVEPGNDVMNLKENGVQEISYTKITPSIQTNNFVGNEKDMKTDITLCNKVAINQSEKIITIMDYDALDPKDLLTYDKRTTFKFFKDSLMLNHSLFTLIFKKSLREPPFIMLLKLVFTLSMQFGLNAMLITDSVIDARADDPSKVLFIDKT